MTLRLNRRDVEPKVLKGDARLLIEIPLLSRHGSGFRLHNLSLLVQLAHTRLREAPIPSYAEKFVMRIALAGSSWTRDVAQSVSPPRVGLDMLVEGGGVIIGIRRVLHGPRSDLALPVEKDHVVKPSEMLRALANVAVSRLSLPDDLVHKGIWTKDLVAQDFSVVADVGAEMEEQDAVVGEKLVDEHKTLVEHLEV